MPTIAEALASARSHLPHPIPTPIPGPTGGLLAWAADPSTPCPLPPFRDAVTRAGRQSWPAGLLPAEALAADLAARGLTGSLGRSYALHGEPVTPDDAARMAADVLADTAAIVREPHEVYAALWDGARTSFEGMVAAKTLGDSLAREDLPRAYWAKTLDATARDLRTSAPARRNVLSLVRSHLPTGRPVRALDDAAAFLATFDSAPVVERPSLGRAYAAAGCPGGLSDPALYALAAERWGRILTVKGTRLWRPSPTVARPALRLLA